MFEVALKNNNKPDLGAVTVEFPIPEDRYKKTIRALNKFRSARCWSRTAASQTFVRLTALLCAG